MHGHPMLAVREWAHHLQETERRSWITRDLRPLRDSRLWLAVLLLALLALALAAAIVAQEGGGPGRWEWRAPSILF